MADLAFFTKDQAFALITQLIDKEYIRFPDKESTKFLDNDRQIENLEAIGETLLALLRQLTGEPGIKPSEAEGLIRELNKLKKDREEVAPF